MCFLLLLFLLVLSISFAFFFLLSSSLDVSSDPWVTKQALSSSPSPLGYAPSLLSREDLAFLHNYSSDVSCEFDIFWAGPHLCKLRNTSVVRL